MIIEMYDSMIDVFFTYVLCKRLGDAIFSILIYPFSFAS